MAQRRMFSLQIVDTDAFMDMPLSTQALYFHLGMRADDDGFLSNARRLQRLVGASDDDLKLLVMKRFIIAFESGVIVLRHWKISNYIQKDRYRPTAYTREKSMLYLTADGAYTDLPEEGIKPAFPPAVEKNVPALEDAVDPDTSNVSNLYTTVYPDPDTKTGNLYADPDTKTEILDTNRIHRIGKVSLGEVSLGEVNINNLVVSSPSGRNAHEKSQSAVEEYLSSRGLTLCDYHGVTGDTIREVQLLSEKLFRQWTRRLPTKYDVTHVFLAAHVQTKDDATEEWTITFPPEKQELLAYAFESAANAGKPGDWNYINGTLRNLQQRGIETIEQAEEYDFSRVTLSQAH